MMTALSCAAIGLAFVLAVALLVLAGAAIGLMPAWWRKMREAPARSRKD
jgi:ABC-type xylose transport system permease subunit